MLKRLKFHFNDVQLWNVQLTVVEPKICWPPGTASGLEWDKGPGLNEVPSIFLSLHFSLPFPY